MSKDVANMIRSILRTTSLLLVGCCLAIPSGLSAQASSSTSAHVQGTVFLGTNNSPLFVEGANVALYGDTGITSTLTDRDGKFSFADVEPPGVYLLQVSYRGVHAEQNVMVPAGAVIQVSLQLQTPDSDISKP